VVTYPVSQVTLTFSSPINLESVSAADVVIVSPTGEPAPVGLTLSGPDSDTLGVTVAPQTSPGFYEVYVGPQVHDIYGLSLGTAYLGSFVILPPTISGQVTDTNGVPVPYVTLNASGGPMGAVTDVNGFYSLEVPPGWSGTVTPVRAQAQFIPPSRAYTNVTVNLNNANYIMASPGALALEAQLQGSSLQLGWQGIEGATHQVYWSTNLVDWVPYGPALPGTNGPMSVTVPVGTEPAKFFRYSTSQ
jgi:hypothetical protein